MNSSFNANVVLALVVLSFAVATNANVVCGGFIKTLNGQKVDFTHYKLSLTKVTDKSTTMLDVDPFGSWNVLIEDENGEYVLTPQQPTGVVFSPKNVVITLKNNQVQEKDICGEGNDITFAIEGFTLPGKVVAPAGCEKVPFGLEQTVIRLENVKTSESVTTSPSSSGEIIFPSVSFGVYKVVASHSSLSFEDVKQLHINGENAPSLLLKVSPYSVKGIVKTEENEGYQYATAKITNSVTSVIETSKVLKDNSFTFPKTACGTYFVSVEYQNKGIKYSVVPRERNIVVNDRSVELEQFVVKGFTAKGTIETFGIIKEDQQINIVMERKGASAKNVVVLSKQDKEFLVDQLEEGDYSFSAYVGTNKEQSPIKFTKVSVYLKATSTTIPKIQINEAQIVGKVEFLATSESAAKSAKIFIKDEADNIVFQRETSAGKNNLERTFVVSSPIPLQDNKKRYYISVKTYGDQNNADFATKEIKLSFFTDQVNFAQTTSTMTLVVDNEDCSSLFVSLLKFDGSVVDKKQISCKKGEEKFTVPSGSYRLAINNSILCFDLLPEYDLKTSIVVELKSKGFKFDLLSDFELSVDLCSAADNTTCSKINLEPKTVKEICLKENHIANVVHENLVFASQTLSVLEETNNIKKISFVPSFSKFSGSILLENVSNPNLVPIELSIIGNEEKISAKPAKDYKTSLRYDYSFQVPFKPSSPPFVLRPLSGNLNLIFTPQEVSVSTTYAIPSFTANQGIFFKGTTTPNVDEAIVSITGGGLLSQITAKTNASGEFSVGPLSSKYLNDYQLKIERVGYVFSETSASKRPNDLAFEAKKLSSIKVVARSRTGAPLKNVFVAISSEGKRFTAETDSFGICHIPLEPNEYFVRVSLKEYEFEVSSKLIVVVSGEEGLFETTGTRVRYHISGTVSTLNGNVNECNIIVEDVSSKEKLIPSCSNEGKFIVRDLKPNSKYNVRVESADTLLASFPENKLVNLVNEDVEDVDFLVVLGSLEQKTKSLVHGLIDVEVLPEGTTKKAELSFCNRQSCSSFTKEEAFTYHSAKVADGNYVLSGKIDKSNCSCKSRTPKSSLRFKVENGKLFNEEGEQTELRATCSCRYHEGAVELNVSSGVGLFVFLFVFVGFYFRDSLLQFISPFLHRNINSIPNKKKK